MFLHNYKGHINLDKHRPAKEHHQNVQECLDITVTWSIISRVFQLIPLAFECPLRWGQIDPQLSASVQQQVPPSHHWRWPQLLHSVEALNLQPFYLPCCHPPETAETEPLASLPTQRNNINARSDASQQDCNETSENTYKHNLGLRECQWTFCISKKTRLHR